MAFTVVILPLTPSGDIGTKQVFTATASGEVVPGTTSYVWTVDGQPQSSVTNTFEYTLVEPAGPKVIKVVATSTPTGEGSPETAEAQTTLTVNEPAPPVPGGELPYVHPLPWRSSAYIWCGWWVMDEIQKMTLEGKNWKTDDVDSKYYLHRYTLQKMITDYPEVDVQESRNGYIVHKSALDAGIIY